MNNYGYIRVASAIPSVKVADCRFNAEEIIRIIRAASANLTTVVCFPELSITGYTCGDLFSQTLLLEKAKESLKWILDNNNTDTIAIIGMPIEINNMLFNCAVVIHKDKVVGIVPKTHIPNYKEFYEERWFMSGTTFLLNEIDFMGKSVPFGTNLIFDIHSPETDFSVKFGIEICEDLWSPIPPSCQLTLHGAELIFNLSASNDIISKHNYLKELISQQSARCICGYIYSSCGYGESTQDLAFGGKAIIYENGTLITEAKRFQLDSQIAYADIDIDKLSTERRCNTTFGNSVVSTSQTAVKSFANVHIISSVNADYDKTALFRYINPHPFVPSGLKLNERCEEIFSIQTTSLAKRISHVNAKTIVIGVSGGLDSTLALLVCVRTMDLLHRNRTDVVGVTMPGFGTTGRTYNNAISLMKELGVTIKEISIVDACIQHFKDIGHNPEVHDVTYENSQARERTQILMDIANQMNGFVVGTGDLSELALGWCTYNADHMSNYGVNCSIPKTLVKHLVKWVADNSIDKNARNTLNDIIDTPISPELTPGDEKGNILQKTEDLVGPYELHDFFLYNMVRLGYTPHKIYFLAKQIFDKKENSGNKGFGGEPSYYDSESIKKWLTVFCRRFFTQQFKRSCLPDGPKVGSVSISPRGDWRMPSDASFAEWTRECESISENKCQ